MPLRFPDRGFGMQIPGALLARVVRHQGNPMEVCIVQEAYGVRRIDRIGIGNAGYLVVFGIGEILHLSQRVRDGLDSASGWLIGVDELRAVVGILLGGDAALYVDAPRSDVVIGISQGVGHESEDAPNCASVLSKNRAVRLSPFIRPAPENNEGQERVKKLTIVRLRKNE
jgi:hypothetical protein